MRTYRQDQRIAEQRLLGVAGFLTVALVVGFGTRYSPLLVTASALTVFTIMVCIVGMVAQVYRYLRPPGRGQAPERVEGRWTGPFDDSGIAGAVQFPLARSSAQRFGRAVLVSLVLTVLVGWAIGSTFHDPTGTTYSLVVVWVYGVLVSWSFRPAFPTAIVRLRVDDAGITILDTNDQRNQIALPWERLERVQEVPNGRMTRIVVISDSCGHDAHIVYASGNRALLPALRHHGASIRPTQ